MVIWKAIEIADNAVEQIKNTEEPLKAALLVVNRIMNKCKSME